MATGPGLRPPSPVATTPGKAPPVIIVLAYLFGLYVGPVLFLYAVAGLLDRAAGQ